MFPPQDLAVATGDAVSGVRPELPPGARSFCSSCISSPSFLLGEVTRPRWTPLPGVAVAVCGFSQDDTSTTGEMVCGVSSLNSRAQALGFESQLRSAERGRGPAVARVSVIATEALSSDLP